MSGSGRVALSVCVCALLGLASFASFAQTSVTPVRKLPSGVSVQVLREGSGARPTASSQVTVNYRGNLLDGSEFDSSYSRGKPATFPLNRVISCWTEALQTMRVGGKARLTCPSNTAYGNRAHSKIPANSTLIFEVELLEVK